MNTETACELLKTVVYKPGWVLTAEDHTNRFEGSITLRVDYPALNTNRDQSPAFPKAITTYASFPLIVAELDEVDFLHLVLATLLKIEEHESREYFRVAPTQWAPFHPHHIDGMRRWGSLDTDLQFGLA